MTTNDELESLYGPAAAHSEYKVGAKVRYHRTPGDVHTGELLYVVAPHKVLLRSGRTVDAPTSYIVEPDQGGLPDVIYEPDIIVS